MLEIIKKQFESGFALTQAKYFSMMNRGLWPKHHWDLYPMNSDYYHELNPFYVGNVYNPEFFKLSNTMTLRDGYLIFADWLLKNHLKIEKYKNLFIIHPDLAPLLPANQLQHFMSWKLSHPGRQPISQAKKVIIHGLLCQDYFGSLSDVSSRLQELSLLPPSSEILIYMSLKKNPFTPEVKESVVALEMMSLLKDLLPDRKLTIIDTQSFLNITDFRGTYFLDLKHDHLLSADSHLHHYVITRGGSVNQVPQASPADSCFKLALSIHHDLHICPLPQVESKFVDLVFFKKLAVSRELLTDTAFHALLKQILHQNKQLSP
jgi:hypothetical protein